MSHGDGGTTRRALRLLGLLQSRSVWTGPDLAERLEVTTRSIRRDIDRLRSLGYPVNAAQGVGGGYQLGAGRALPPLLLDDEEGVAVAVSLRLATGGTVAGASEAALRALTKLDQVLPAQLRSEIAAILGATELLGGSTAEVDGEALLTLAKACRDRVRAKFDYTARDAEPTSRTVEPVRLVATGRRWYLMGFDVDRDDWRTFRLDRMARVSGSTWRFHPREHPDPVEFVRRSVVSPYTHMARARVHASYDEVREKVSPTSGTVTRIDAQTCLLEVGGNDFDLIAFHLCWIGFEIDLVEPPELRAAFAGLGGRMLRASQPAQP